MSGNLLRRVLPVNDCDVAINDGVGIAVNREIRVEFDAFLFGWHVSSAKKTRPPLNRSAIHGCGCANDTMRNVTNVDIEPVDSNRSSLSASETFRSGSKQRPDFELLLKECFNFFNHDKGTMDWYRER